MRSDTAPLRERPLSAAFLCLAVGALGFLHVFNPSTATFYPTCPFLWATGCYCPGCGSLRALHQLTRGHLAAAFGLNPLMVLSLPFLGYHAGSQLKLVVTGRAMRRIFVGPRLIWALLGLILTYWVLRNLPIYPFTLLAPELYGEPM